MAAKLVEILITALVGIGSAWWGGRLGVTRALDQKRAERGFERRLEWYERAILSLGDLAVAQSHLATSARMGFSEEIQTKNVDVMVGKLPAVHRVFAETKMYATPDGIRALSKLWAANLALPTMRPKDPADLSKGLI